MIESNKGIATISTLIQKPSGNSSVSQETPTSNAAQISGTFPNHVTLTPTDSEYGKLQSRNDYLYKVATTVREAGRVMDHLARMIGEKQEEIFQYEKQYPPFQGQSSEKVELLNSIAALKKQVDALTLVPDIKEVGGAVYGDTENSGNDGLFPLKQYGVHGGEDGLNIASLGLDTTDNDIQKFGKELASASEKLNGKRSQLANETESVYQQITGVKSLGEKMLEDGQQAVRRSEQIKYELSLLPGMSLGSPKGQILLEKMG